LFGSPDRGETTPERTRRLALRQSILDAVRDDAKRLSSRLGGADRRKLDEYLTSVREVEQRVASSSDAPKGPDGFARPAGVPDDVRDHVRLMSDLLVLALQGDLTRVATFVYANEGSNRNYELIGVREGHHELSHHERNPDKQAKIQKINTFHIEQFAYLLDRMAQVREGDGTLLDSCMLVYGSGIGDGNRHNHNDLPVLLFGKGAGTIRPGRHLHYDRNTPLNNLFLSMLDRMDTRIESLGDSSGRLDQLDG
jgi:hypothetical protein